MAKPRRYIVTPKVPIMELVRPNSFIVAAMAGATMEEVIGLIVEVTPTNSIMSLFFHFVQFLRVVSRVS